MNNFGLVLTSNSLNQQINRIRRNGKGFAEMRELIPYLQSGGKIIVMTDVFNDLNDCTVGFLGKNCNVSLLPVRLAKAAGVSLLSAVAELHESSIQIYMGPRLNPENFIADPSKSMQTLLSFFQREIKRNPSIWSVFVRGSLSRYERECRRSTFVSPVLPAKSLSVASNS